MTSLTTRILSLFGLGGGSTSTAPSAAEQQDYQGYIIVASPQRDGAQYRISGQILKRDGERVLSRDFIRADVFPSRDDAIDITFRKGKQIIDQQGASLFADGVETGRA